MVADVTVVVMTRNRRDELLDSLARHQAPVIVVDNASQDGSVEAVRGRYPHVMVEPLQRNVGAVARTIGARMASTPYVAFADDDSWWDEGSLAAGAQILRDHPSIGLLSARILVGPDEEPDPVCAEMASSPLPTPASLPGPRLLGFVACAAMVRRDAFLAVGGFDDVIVFPGEEERVAIDLAAAGWDLVYAETLTVHHHPSPWREDADKRQRGLGRSRLLTAVLRRSWRHVGHEVFVAATGARTSRAGALSALPDLRRALRARRRVPSLVEHELRLLGHPLRRPGLPTHAAIASP